jgi:hypothetical protein
MNEINARPRSREELEAAYGDVWDSQQLANDFEVTAFIAPCVVVRRKADNMVGSLEFQNQPRIYFNFQPDRGSEWKP